VELKMAAATARALDMTDVGEGGGAFNPSRVPSGDYLAKIVKVEDGEVKNGDNAGAAMWVFTVVLEDYKARKFPYRCTLTPNQLWKVRNLCTAVGVSVPKKKVKIDPNKLTNKLLAVTMEDGEYKGREQSEVAAVFPASELEGHVEPDIDEEEDDEEEVEETPPPKAKKKAAAPPPEDDEDEDEDEADDEEDEEEEPPPPPRKKAAAKTAATKRAAAKAVKDEELDELDLDDL
jgi:hypothetical protein